MNEASKRFVEENTPEVLQAKTVNDALDVISDWIDLNGFGPDSLYNEKGIVAQAVYDDIFDQND